MALFDIFKKSSTPGPYKEESANLVYQLLFCDNLDLYKKNNQQPAQYPWNILFSDKLDPVGLQQVIDDQNTESRIKILAYNQLRSAGQTIAKKDLLAVIVEVGLENGPAVIAAFRDGTARYINETGHILIWETRDQQSDVLINDLFRESEVVVQKIGPWHDARRPHPAKDFVRISFLVADGLYFGEGPCEVLFNDPMGAAALSAATKLMQYLTEKASGPIRS